MTRSASILCRPHETAPARRRPLKPWRARSRAQWLDSKFKNLAAPSPEDPLTSEMRELYFAMKRRTAHKSLTRAGCSEVATQVHFEAKPSRESRQAPVWLEFQAWRHHQGSTRPLAVHWSITYLSWCHARYVAYIRAMYALCVYIYVYVQMYIALLANVFLCKLSRHTVKLG